MNSSDIEELIEKDIESLGCIIWGIEFSGRPNNKTIRIYIDKDDGVSINDCERISKHISKVLEVSFTSDNYLLEVSSPGLERKFFKNKQYLNFIGSNLKVRYIENDKKYKTMRGKLISANKQHLILEENEERFVIPFQSVQKANLEFIGG